MLRRSELWNFFAISFVYAQVENDQTQEELILLMLNSIPLLMDSSIIIKSVIFAAIIIVGRRSKLTRLAEFVVSPKKKTEN